MRSGILLTLLCLLLIVAPAYAVCNWDGVDTAAHSDIAECTGFVDSNREHWPRLPTDTEIASAKDDYLEWLQGGDYQTRIEETTIVKFHYCEGSWVNHVEMRIAYSWWWQSTTGAGEWQSAIDDTFLVYTPASKTFEFAANHVPSMYWFSPSSYTQGFASGPCSSGKTAATVSPDQSAKPPADEEEFPWVVVIGALGALGAAGLVGAKALGDKGKSSQKEKKKDIKEDVRYILQLSADHLTVSPDKDASLKATAWKVVGENPPAPAPEAVITATLPADIRGLAVAPGTGQGEVTFQVSLDGAAGVQTSILQIGASVGGKGTSATVTLEFEAKTNIEFD